MFKSLRNRLILSHTLPFLIIISLMGIAIVYFGETRFLLPELTKQLVSDARFVSTVARDEPQIWVNPAEAELFVTQVNPNSLARAMLLTPDGTLLASTQPSDLPFVGKLYNLPNQNDLQSGDSVSIANYSPRLGLEVIDVYFPVTDANSNLIGIVRMTYLRENVYQEFAQLRSFMSWVLGISLLAGILLGSILALTINRPIKTATQAVFDLAHGDISLQIDEKGPEEVRTLLQAVNYLATRLHELENSRKQLLSNLVHELGRPLGALRAAISALQKGAAKDKSTMEEYLIGMDGEAARLQHLLNDLAHVQGQILGTLELNRQPIDLRKWLPTVLSPWQAAAEEKNIYWDVTLPADLPALIADPDRLAQAIGNLTSNAIKFTPSGRKVTVSAGMLGGEVWIRVSDDGPGISQDDIDKIFVPFYRGKHGGRIPQGMGLGLGIARELIHAHRGRLEVKSDPGEGSQFTIWLPLSTSYPQH
jgi:two-component system sensor histidine kinase BaeS